MPSADIIEKLAKETTLQKILLIIKEEDFATLEDLAEYIKSAINELQ
jgi:hypothetical protein